MTDLQKMFEGFKQELYDYGKLSKIDFLLKYEYNFKDKIIKDYELYIKDNEDEDPDNLLNYDEWKEEYEEEIGDELYEMVSEYFTSYGIDEYKGEYYSIYDIMIAGGSPNIYLRIETKNELVIWKGYWGGETIKEDISEYYETIYYIYNLDLI